jgi:poly-gamma-glutamate synthesis protein (capsule biosynthesis protein)
VAGDVTLRNLPSGQSPFRQVAPLFQAADVTIINLEGPLTTRTAGTPHKGAADLAAREQYLVKGSPVYAHYLPEAGVDVATLANNHTMDYRAGGLQDTVDLLTKLGVATCGAGVDAAARRPAVVSALRGKVAVLAYLAFVSEGGLAACTPAADQRAGVAVVRSTGEAVAAESREALRQDIVTAHKQAEVVIVVFHWGIQKADTPLAYHRVLAHTAAELGASAVVGHHPHVLQGVEWYGGVPILYSLGNFVFSPSVGTRGETGVFDLIFWGGKAMRVDFHPARIEDSAPRPLTGEAGRKLSRRLLGLSQGLGKVEGKIGEDGGLSLTKPQG